MFIVRSGDGYVQRKTHGLPVMTNDRKYALKIGVDEAMEICAAMHESGLSAVVIEDNSMNKTLPDKEERMIK